MKIEDFKSGEYRQQFQYKSFTPTHINHEWTWDDSTINVMLERATRAIAELNAFSFLTASQNVDHFIRMHVTKEANTSSRIEGTQTNIEDAVKDEEDVSPEKRDDWREVQNYVSAMNAAITELQTLPLSSRLIRQTHKILMQSVRGQSKMPGEYRQSQNWIGGTNLTTAVFIPPAHDEIPDLISDMEKFLQNEEIRVPTLIRIAIAHYQFETIHPFLDGNGRIGRLLIPLYLMSKNCLEKPSLYLSDYFERNRGAYYDALTIVRHSNDLRHWIRFFLNGVIETAEKGKLTFQDIMTLKEETDKKIFRLGARSENAKKLVERLYGKPVITANQAAKLLDLSNQRANALIAEFMRLGLLEEITGYRRNRIYVFKKYLSLFETP